jgi:hypothetical protein
LTGSGGSLEMTAAATVLGAVGQEGSHGADGGIIETDDVQDKPGSQDCSCPPARIIHVLGEARKFGFLLTEELGEERVQQIESEAIEFIWQSFQADDGDEGLE